MTRPQRKPEDIETINAMAERITEYLKGRSD